MIEFFQMSDLRPFSQTAEGDAQITQSFVLKKEVDVLSHMYLFTVMASYQGEKAPTVEFSLHNNGTRLYISHTYNFAARNNMTIKQWRVPPSLFHGTKMFVSVNVPEGTTLTVRSFGAEICSGVKDWNGGLRFNAHLGFLSMITKNTMPTYEMAALCGYPACIVNPRRTADGVFVCLHNESINETARDENGNPPEEDLRIDQMNYEDLEKWDFGSFKNDFNRGYRIPTLDGFFALCSRTGMRPMFSTHPIFTREEWLEIRAMLIKHGILHNLHIKSFSLENLVNAYAVFGTEIDGYTWDRVEFSDEDLAALVAAGIDKKGCRLGMEIAYKNYHAEVAQKIVAEGLFASVWAVNRRTADEYEELISWGVTEFTEDHHCSMGLNW